MRAGRQASSRCARATGGRVRAYSPAPRHRARACPCPPRCSLSRLSTRKDALVLSAVASASAPLSPILLSATSRAPRQAQVPHPPPCPSRPPPSAPRHAHIPRCPPPRAACACLVSAGACVGEGERECVSGHARLHPHPRPRVHARRASGQQALREGDTRPRACVQPRTPAPRASMPMPSAVLTPKD